MACELLESAGAFMMRQAATCARMESMLAVRSPCVSDQPSVLLRAITTARSCSAHSAFDGVAAPIDMEGYHRFISRAHTTLARAGGLTGLLATQIMARLRANRNIDHGKAAIVDSALYAVKPPPTRPLATRMRTPLQRYVRHLLLDCIGRDKAAGGEKGASDSADVLARLRALPWDEGECEDFVLRMGSQGVLLPPTFACLVRLSHTTNDSVTEPS